MQDRKKKNAPVADPCSVASQRSVVDRVLPHQAVRSEKRERKEKGAEREGEARKEKGEEETRENTTENAGKKERGK